MSAPTRLVDEHRPQPNGVYPHKSFDRRHRLQVMDAGSSIVVASLLVSVGLFAIALGVGSIWLIWRLVH